MNLVVNLCLLDLFLVRKDSLGHLILFGGIFWRNERILVVFWLFGSGEGPAEKAETDRQKHDW